MKLRALPAGVRPRTLTHHFRHDHTLLLDDGLGRCYRHLGNAISAIAHTPIANPDRFLEAVAPMVIRPVTAWLKTPISVTTLSLMNKAQLCQTVRVGLPWTSTSKMNDVKVVLSINFIPNLHLSKRPVPAIYLPLHPPPSLGMSIYLTVVLFFITRLDGTNAPTTRF